MKDNDLEHLLSSLRPAPPSPELAQRVQRDMELIAAFREAAPEQEPFASRRKPAAWLSNLVWAGLGAAAAVVAMTVFHTSPAGTVSRPLASFQSATSASAILPVSSSREWVDVEDQGISFSVPDSPERLVKVRSLERRQWIDPRDGAEYTVEVPQEESVVLPMKFQ